MTGEVRKSRRTVFLRVRSYRGRASFVHAMLCWRSRFSRTSRRSGPKSRDPPPERGKSAAKCPPSLKGPHFTETIASSGSAPALQSQLIPLFLFCALTAEKKPRGVAVVRVVRLGPVLADVRRRRHLPDAPVPRHGARLQRQEYPLSNLQHAGNLSAAPSSRSIGLSILRKKKREMLEMRKGGKGEMLLAVISSSRVHSERERDVL